MKLHIRFFWDEWVLPRFQMLAPREQKLVLMAALLLPLMVLVFGIILPIHDQRENRLRSASVLAAQAEEADRLAAMIGSGNRQQHSGSLLSTVDKTAREQGVKRYMTHIRPQAGMSGLQRLSLQLKDAPYADVVKFLLRLDKQGLVLESVKIRAAKESGIVHLQASVRG